ncbi:hypothetical protein HYG81_13365 [Natrinema zhouii]|uniref:Uncharacterized protein n=1 Tax=Natrinema zhouii TaxID=1710539 RepID=A0A7D6H1L7_9EURY|nr:hypothetical protein [Natrinema zhouii]QLK25087.1 hypothetical protein HYG81_13365 [Natrinema zhouii]
MNEQQLRPVYLAGIGISAYALWYFASAGSNLVAVAFGLVTAFLVVRLRLLVANS